MIGLKHETRQRTTVTTETTLELTAEQVETILKNWAIKNQGFCPSVSVELTESQGMVSGALISQVTVEETE